MKHLRYIIVPFAVLTLAVGLFIWASQARALFSFETEIKNNVIKTGSIAFTVSPTEKLLAADALLPGQSVTNTLQVKNTGLSPLQLTLSAKKSAGYSTVYDQLHFTISDDTHIIFDGLLKDLANTPITTNAIAPQQAVSFNVSLELPITADSSVDNLSATISFIVAAMQAS